MAPFHVRRKVCIAAIFVRSKLEYFASHKDGSNADFATHMEWRHRFRDQKIVKVANSANFLKKIFEKDPAPRASKSCKCADARLRNIFNNLRKM